MPKAIINFQCTIPNCGSIISEEIWVSEPSWVVEVMSEGDVVEDHDIVCDGCGTDYMVETVHGIWGIRATVDGREIEVGIQHESDFYDYEEYLLGYEPESDTKAFFQKACKDLLQLIDDHGDRPDSILNRMVFSQLIAAMEAYLSDKILCLSNDYEVIKRRIVENANFIKDQKIELKEVLLDTSKAENLYKVCLQKILYHDLPKVEKLYCIALDKAFFPSDKSIEEALKDAVKLRHDCVHRNGANSDGEVHQFDRHTINALANNITALVEHIEDQAKNATSTL